MGSVEFVFDIILFVRISAISLGLPLNQNALHSRGDKDRLLERRTSSRFTTGIAFDQAVRSIKQLLVVVRSLGDYLRLQHSKHS